MTQNPSLPQNKTLKTSPLPQRIPITYLWFGKDVPEDYLISLAELDYPVVFLKNPPIQKTFSRQLLDIQKSDYYRLQYLYDNGGFYSDFDNIINYDCLMKLIEPYRYGDKIVFMSIGNHTRAKLNEMSNNLIFAPYPKMPILKKMLDGIKENNGKKVWQFAGMRYVARFKQPIQLKMDKCVKHTGDWSWFDASNKILKKKTPPHSHYSKKLLKKIDIIEENINLQASIEQIKKQKIKINTELEKARQQNNRLWKQINSAKVQTPHDSVQNVKAQIEHKSVKINQNILNQIAWTREKLMMQNRLQFLAAQNDNLQFEKDIFIFATGGSFLLVLMLVILGCVLLGNNKKKQFNKICNTQKTAVEQE